MKKKNLSQYNSSSSINNDKYQIGIVVSEWNELITNSLKEAAVQVLLEQGVLQSNIHIHSVPGSFELPLGAEMLLDSNFEMDGIICLGCVIQGETRHFDFISQATADGIMRVALDYQVPVAFGVLTCQNMEQAMERSGGKHGNKGVEAAITCLKMIQLQHTIKS